MNMFAGRSAHPLRHLRACPSTSTFGWLLQCHVQCLLLHICEQGERWTTLISIHESSRPLCSITLHNLADGT
jgi:hypothetical protein